LNFAIYVQGKRMVCFYEGHTYLEPRLKKRDTFLHVKFSVNECLVSVASAHIPLLLDLRSRWCLRTIMKGKLITAVVYFIKGLNNHCEVYVSLWFYLQALQMWVIGIIKQNLAGWNTGKITFALLWVQEENVSSLKYRN
jgi:hypothetical protein